MDAQNKNIVIISIISMCQKCPISFSVDPGGAIFSAHLDHSQDNYDMQSNFESNMLLLVNCFPKWNCHEIHLFRYSTN